MVASSRNFFSRIFNDVAYMLLLSYLTARIAHAEELMMIAI